MSVLLGPILQFRCVSNERCTVSAMVICDLKDEIPQGVLIGGAALQPPIKIAEIPLLLPNKAVWRFDINVALGAGQIAYVIAGVEGAFVIPNLGESPRMAYGSCNGFSDPKLRKQVDRHNDRWLHMAQKHKETPFHLLLLGGDQVYSDEMWKSVPELKRWTALDRPARLVAGFTSKMREQVDKFFADLYVEHWSQPELQHVFRSIPSIMMWDDHDIMDGWGSYPKDLHNCKVFGGIFDVARQYFQVLQQQCRLGEVRPSTIPGQTAFHMGFSGLGSVTLLIPDLRSERQPDPEQIIAPQSWNAIYDWLDQTTSHKHLLVMSSIPVAYLDLGQIEKLLGTLPGQQELEDDLRDHWRSVAHLQERLRLVHRLLSHAADTPCRVTIVSGDVHVGAVSAIESTRKDNAGNASVINQLVSTGIVHPAPPAIVRYVMDSISERVETIDRGITATMQPIAGRGRYLIGQRNWLSIEPEDATHRIWANWHLEGSDHPLTKVIHG